MSTKNVDTLVSLKAMRIRDTSKYQKTGLDEQYKIKEKYDKDRETDWTKIMNVGEDSKKNKPELVKRLKKFSSMWGLYLGKIWETEHLIELTENAKLSFQQAYRKAPMNRKCEAEKIEKMTKLDVMKQATSE